MISMILGLVGSTLPEVFKWLNKAQDNKHELQLMDRQLDIQKVIEAEKTIQASINQETVMYQADTSLLEKALESQDKAVEVEGVYNWVKSLNAAIRPLLGTVVVVILFMGILAVFFPAVFLAYKSLLEIPLIVDSFGVILSYWLGRRALDKGGR